MKKISSLDDKLFLVGDNPFHNISHLSQQRARARTEDPSNPKYAASLIISSLKNGANGFSFSVSETTLSILRELKKQRVLESLHLYPIVPYAFEYVRLSTQLGGISGLVRKLSVDLVKSKSAKALCFGLKGALTADPVSMMKMYLTYELSRVRSVDRNLRLESLLLHQLVTDMALALNLDWFFKEYIDFLSSQKLLPGFNTGNFSFLIKKFGEWEIDLRKIVVAAPFNKVGFQMTPSKEECERTLRTMPEPAVIAISIMAAGYIPPNEAAEYAATLPNIKGVAVGISKEKYARDTFRILQKHFIPGFC